MSNAATMFLNQISVVDHAFIDENGKVVGGSFNPDFIVSGDMDPVEHVVVDFSTVKKDLKKIIDHKETGFDHKLWFIDGVSGGTIEYYANDDNEAYVSIKTPAVELDLPANAVKRFSASAYNLDQIGLAIASYVQVEMVKLYPTIKIECRNNTVAHTTTPNTFSTNGILPIVAKYPSYFTYSHGLKDSTSWGCQNIAHGHLSFLEFVPFNNNTRLLQDAMAAALDGAIFIKRENVQEETDEDGVWIKIKYTTPRGTFVGRYNSDLHNILIMDNETTIENLVSEVCNHFMLDLKKAGVREVYMSEGLSKGALLTIE